MTISSTSYVKHDPTWIQLVCTFAIALKKYFIRKRIGNNWQISLQEHLLHYRYHKSTSMYVNLYVKCWNVVPYKPHRTHQHQESYRHQSSLLLTVMYYNWTWLGWYLPRQFLRHQIHFVELRVWILWILKRMHIGLSPSYL